MSKAVNSLGGSISNVAPCERPYPKNFGAHRAIGLPPSVQSRVLRSQRLIPGRLQTVHLRVLAVFLLAAAVSAAVNGTPKPTDNNCDALGDMLPNGAVCRMGTIRFRHCGRILSVAFSPNGEAMASAGLDGTVRLWKPDSGEEIARFDIPKKGYYDWIWSVVFSPDSKRVAAAGDSGVWLWDWSKNQKPALVARPLQDIAVVRITFSAGGKKLAGADFHGNVRVWDLATTKEIARVPAESTHPALLSSIPVALSPDGTTVAFSSSDKAIRLLALDSGKERIRLEGHQCEILSFSICGKLLALGGEEGGLSLWEVATGRQIWRQEGQPSQCSSLIFSANGQTVISGDSAGRIRIWEVKSGKLLQQLQGPCTGVSCLGISPDGKTLVAVGDDDESLWRWDLPSGKELSFPNCHRSRVVSVAFAPDGHRLATASNDGVCLWELPGGKQITCFGQQNGKVCPFVFGT